MSLHSYAYTVRILLLNNAFLSMELVKHLKAQINSCYTEVSGD